MPTLARASPDRELERLIRLYLRAETDIINEIGRLRSQGLVDYHAVAALERVQAILRQLETQDWEYVPRLVEAQFYVRRPDARAVPGETVEKHRAGYLNAKTLTSTQTDIVQRLTMNLMGQLTDAHSTAECPAGPHGTGHLPARWAGTGSRTAGCRAWHQPERARLCGRSAPGRRDSLH